MSEMDERPYPTIAAPRRILLRHADDPILDRLLNPPPPDRLPEGRSIKLARHQLPKPAQNRIWLRRYRHFGQCLAPQPVCDFGQGTLLPVQ